MSSLRDLFVGITFQDNATRTINQLNRSMDTSENNARGMGSEIQRTEKKTSAFSSTVQKVGGIIAGAFALDKIKDFGISMIENAASAQAVNAQFSQVFGKTQKDAQNTVNQLGKDFGMIPNRIKPAMAQMTSMFKGLGINTKKSMGMAKSAVTLTADAAAFYDKSFEDANASLNSFIKGNYEGGESIGLFANETQLASWAAKNLGVDWKKLDEAGKQTARLKFAEAMQKAAGATGQASRESSSYENQLGNLKQSWSDLKAKLGDNILGPAVTGLQTLSTWLQKIDVNKIKSGFNKFGSYLSDTFGPVINDFKTMASGLWDAFKDNGGLDATKSALDGIKSGLSWLKDNSGVITAGIAGLAGAFVAFQVLNGINSAIGIFNTLMVAFRTGTVMATLAQWGLNTAMLANPFTWVAVGIGALIAVGVLLWKNWDTVKKKAGELWVKTKEVFGGIFEWGKSKIQPVVNFFQRLADKFRDFRSAISNFKLPKWVSTIGSTIGNAASKIKNFVNGSHASGLSRVPFDGYRAELHKDEAVLTADQSNALRDAGILKNNSGKPMLDFSVAPASSPAPIVSPTTSKNNNSIVFKPTVNIDMSGSNANQADIKKAIKEALDEQYQRLLTVFEPEEVY